MTDFGDADPGEVPEPFADHPLLVAINEAERLTKAYADALDVQAQASAALKRARREASVKAGKVSAAAAERFIKDATTEEAIEADTAEFSAKALGALARGAGERMNATQSYYRLIQAVT